MTYPRVFGPAGLPFELNALSKWLKERFSFTETQAAQIVREASGLSFSTNGLESESIAHEIQRGRAAGISKLLAGIALVEVTGIHRATLEQIQDDLAACHDAAGVVLSWDLWHIPSKYISTISELYK